MAKPHDVVSPRDWIEARKALLAKEKELTRLREQVTAQRQALPWERVEKSYVFDTPAGKQTLAELFDGRSQLIVYHFMFGPDQDEGCKICSLCADHYAPLAVHLAARDVTLVTASRAPLDKLEAYRRRMGWDMKWVSSLGSDFNADFRVSFTDEQVERGSVDYNYGTTSFGAGEAPGVSAFALGEDGAVFHTYSAYARGLERLLGIYEWLDIVPRGRDEDRLSWPMEWIRHHDRY